MKKKVTNQPSEVHVQKQYPCKGGKGHKTIDAITNKNDEVFWTDFKPKVENRFIVYIKDKKGQTVIPSFVIRSVNRPSITLNKYGKPEYSNLFMECYDPIVPSTTQSVMKAIMEKNTVWDITLKILGPVGNTVEEWEFRDAKLVSVDFGNCDWRRTGEAVNVDFCFQLKTVTLKY